MVMGMEWQSKWKWNGPSNENGIECEENRNGNIRELECNENELEKEWNGNGM